MSGNNAKQNLILFWGNYHSTESIQGAALVLYHLPPCNFSKCLMRTHGWVELLKMIRESLLSEISIYLVRFLRIASANECEGPSASPHHPALWCASERGPTSDEEWFNKLPFPPADWLSLCETMLYFLQFISWSSACDNMPVYSEKGEFCAFLFRRWR